MSASAPLDGRLYRIALWLYPSAFRREFSPEMIRDFDEARREAESTPHGLSVFRVQMASDLLRSVVLQWWRSGWPLIVAVSIAGPLAGLSAIASAWRRAELFVLPTGTVNDELLGLEVLVVTVFLVIATTIIITQWCARQLRRRQRR